MEKKNDLSTKEKKKLILRAIAWGLFVLSLVFFAIGASVRIKGEADFSSYFTTMLGLWIVAFFCYFYGNT